jgi:hypothetical protein
MKMIDLTPEEKANIKEILPYRATLYFIRKTIYPLRLNYEVYGYAKTYRVYIFYSPIVGTEITDLISRLYKLPKTRRTFNLKLIHNTPAEITAQLGIDLYGEANAFYCQIL